MTQDLGAGSGTMGMIDRSPGARTEFPDAQFESARITSPEENDYIPEIFERAQEQTLEAAGGVRWAPTDRASPCYSHLLVDSGDNLTIDKTFELGKAEFELLLAANRYQPKGKNDIIAFGLRGARLRGSEKLEEVDRLTLEDARPDHRTFRCVIGFYFRAKGRFSAYTGSTVPWHGYMSEGMTNNLLPTGTYVYKKGIHNYKNPVEPALRLSDANGSDAGEATVLRTKRDLVFGLTDVWDKCNPTDNIHCAYSNTTFSSLGCQTIKGPRDGGLWADFQQTLEDLPRGARVDYVLITGAEASIAAAAVRAGVPAGDPEVQRRLGRLRVGSESEHVKRLQARLGQGESGYFGPQTKKALTEWQAANGVPADGIYAPALDDKTGWGIFAALLAPMPQPQAPPAGTSEPMVYPDVPRPIETKVDPPAPANAPVETYPEPVPLDEPAPAGRPAPAPAPAPMAAAPPAPAPVAAPAPAPSPAPVASPAPAPKPAPAPAAAKPLPDIALTPETLRRFAPKAKPEYAAILGQQGNDVLTRFGINENARRFCHFMAQVGHECGGFTIAEESLKYSAPRMLVIFGAGVHSAALTASDAQRLVGNDEAFAERVYGLGNPKMAKNLGNTEPGDGYRYRGRGFLQITGRAAYREMGKKIGVDLEADPDKVGQPLYALMTAAAFWDNRKLNDYADRDDIILITKRINGGRNGLEDRQQRYAAAKQIWAVGGLESARGPELESARGRPILEFGSIGPAVVELKKLLSQLGYSGFEMDQVFGRTTHLAVVRFKLELGMTGDGVVDAATWDALDREVKRAARDVLQGGGRPVAADEEARARTQRRGRAVRSWGFFLLLAAAGLIAIQLVERGLLAFPPALQAIQGNVPWIEIALMAFVALAALRLMMLGSGIARSRKADTDEVDLGIRREVNVETAG